jgi:KDO2-lipid IV(A) lauroyltransferase
LHIEARVRYAVREALGPAVIDLVRWMIRRRDLEGTQRLGRRLGDFGFRVDRRHRERALANLRLAYGEELSEERAQEIVHEAFRHVVMLAIEIMSGADTPLAEIREVVALRGEEHLQAALAQGQGVVLFSGHLGNWEAGGVRLIAGDYALRPWARPPPTPRLARKFYELHEQQNARLIPYTEGLRGIIRALKENGVVPILPDRFARGRGVSVPFFGHPAHVWQTPALLAARVGCPVLSWQTIRGEDGTFVSEIGPPIPMRFTDDREADLIANTARCMALLEQQVRAKPEQYAWFYALWRKPPTRGTEAAPESPEAGSDVEVASA